MTGYLDRVVQEVRDWDDARPRSQQTDLGWSHMADCRSYMGFKLRGDWATDDDENWRAVAGTALHTWMETVRKAACAEEGLDASFNLTVEYGGVRGHLDEVVWSEAAITDWKFPRLASVRVWDDPDVLEEKFIQPQGYMAALLAEHYDEWARRTPPGREPVVRMLVAPVDGKFADWRVYERPFDVEAADAALDRYQQVIDAVAHDEPLPRDKPVFWCERFCEFYGLCRGSYETGSELEEITDPELAAAVEAYGEANARESAAVAAKKELRPLIEGLRGTARGWRIFMSKQGAGKMVPDEQAVVADYDRLGLQVPFISKPGRPPALHVVREKKG